MAIWNLETKEFYCECGCGRIIPPWCSYYKGHWPRTEEFRERMSQLKLGTVFSEEARENMRLEQARRRSEEPEIFDRISESKSGILLSEEHKKAISAGVLRAHREDPSIRERMSASHEGVLRGPLSDEHRQNISEAMKDYYRKNPGILHGAAARGAIRPTSTESLLDEWLQKEFPDGWKYVGGGQIWIGRRNPDFVSTNGKKAVIELFGGYFHNDYDPLSDRSEEGTIRYYSEFGYNCLVVWANYPKDLVLEWTAIVDWIRKL